MSGSVTERKLAAILAADVVGFSRQMGADETRRRARFDSLLGLGKCPLSGHGALVRNVWDGRVYNVAGRATPIRSAAESGRRRL